MFYNTAMGNPPPEMAAYRDALTAMTRLPGIAGWVEVHDYAELLAPHAAELSALYERFAVGLERDLDAMVDPETWGRLFRSFRAAMSTRTLGLSYAQMKAVFGPQPSPAAPLVQRVDAMARDGLKTQLAIKLAADAMGFLDGWRPDHLRASCHKGLKHGRGVLVRELTPLTDALGAASPDRGAGDGAQAGSSGRTCLLFSPACRETTARPGWTIPHPVALQCADNTSTALQSCRAPGTHQPPPPRRGRRCHARLVRRTPAAEAAAIHHCRTQHGAPPR
ncbi:hypothetical protein [uncultured Thiohalocapsa sp.]|uniref:hypothetical protein n=1 Tax=uncultured Thiohalocapsa sp. TaxID=768990 RepID=UPI0025EE6A3B|nr:hypothetical protein [uncultured Thiohalocapsa sp.]